MGFRVAEREAETEERKRFMALSRSIGAVLVIAGVIANNYTYLHDVIWGKHAGWIELGLKSYIVAGVTFAAVIIGAFLLLRAQGKKPGA